MNRATCNGEYRQFPDKSDAKVAELVDALDLGSSGVSRESSSLSFRTSISRGPGKLELL